MKPKAKAHEGQQTDCGAGAGKTRTDSSDQARCGILLTASGYLAAEEERELAAKLIAQRGYLVMPWRRPDARPKIGDVVRYELAPENRFAIVAETNSEDYDHQIDFTVAALGRDPWLNRNARYVAFYRIVTD